MKEMYSCGSGMVEAYKGIVVSITKISEKNWSSNAEYSSPRERAVHLESPDSHATEEHARQAALQAAIERIDRTRVSRGEY
jgi:hypothetical protein